MGHTCPKARVTAMNQSKFHLHGVYILVEEGSRKQAIDPQAVVNSTKKDKAKQEDRQPSREGGSLGKESGKASEEQWPFGG